MHCSIKYPRLDTCPISDLFNTLYLVLGAKADDNGTYISKGSVTKFYMYNEEGSCTSHKDGNGVWYVNIRESKGYRKEIVPANEIYELKREYHTSKSNPKFSQLSPQLKVMLKKNQGPFMLSRTNGHMGRINASTFLGMGMLPNQPVANTTAKIPVFSQRSIIWSLRGYQRIKFITPLPELELVLLVKLYLVPS